MFLARPMPLLGLILSVTIWMTAAQAQADTIGVSLDWWKLDEGMLTFVCLPERAPEWCADARAGVRPALTLPLPPPATSAQGRRRSRSGPTPPSTAAAKERG